MPTDDAHPFGQGLLDPPERAARRDVVGVGQAALPVRRGNRRAKCGCRGSLRGETCAITSSRAEHRAGSVEGEDEAGFLREIHTQFTGDGLKVESLKIEDGKLNLLADY